MNDHLGRPAYWTGLPISPRSYASPALPDARARASLLRPRSPRRSSTEPKSHKRFQPFLIGRSHKQVKNPHMDALHVALSDSRCLPCCPAHRPRTAARAPVGSRGPARLRRSQRATHRIHRRARSAEKSPEEYPALDYSRAGKADALIIVRALSDRRHHGDLLTGKTLAGGLPIA